MITGDELREKFIEFFKQQGHTAMPSASLMPEHDPSALFITAGMHPLVPFLMGEQHPGGKRLVSAQKSLRTVDIEEVGDQWHNTFFEMLGNWSLGDYFKTDSIKWSWQFLTSGQWLGIDPEKLSVSVFEGDDHVPRDQEAADMWLSVGMPEERIHFFGRDDNWWGPAGETGPCGPDTEIFYDTGAPACGPKCDPSCSCGKYAEIWNNVFMEYNKTIGGQYEPLSQKNIDTGMGLERTVAILNGKDNVYDTDLFQPVMAALKQLLPDKGQDTLVSYRRSMRIVADHIRAATFILGDPQGVSPSNMDQGYVLRRLIRRAVRHARVMGIEKSFAPALARAVIDKYGHAYGELEQNRSFIMKELAAEEEKFAKTIARGMKRAEEIIRKTAESGESSIAGEDAFHLFDTFGFPLEMTAEIARERGLEVDEKGFSEAFKRHQELSRAGAEERFKGGLADHSEMSIKYHTATHLLHQALKDVLGDHVAQKGSNITPKRLRFDFSHPEKLTDEQKKEVEDNVNLAIKQALPVTCELLSMEDARRRGAVGLFEDQYGDKVKVYFMGDYSKEFCGGPHVKNTSELGHFRIKKEESVGAGVRRIKAVLE